MSKQNPLSVILEISQELREVADLLQKYLGKVCPNVQPLREASSECASGRNNSDYFDYSVRNLDFRLTAANLVEQIPKNLTNLSIKLTTEVKGCCFPPKTAINADQYNPLETLEFNLMLFGQYNDCGRLTNVYCVWHLDRDEVKGRATQKFMHPFYHFQHGGRKMNESLRYGSSLILESPRIAHPPMDAILGIDFVLTNFVERKDILDLRQDLQYKRIMRNAQIRMWKPYFMALANSWNTVIDPNWNSEMIFPQLIR